MLRNGADLCVWFYSVLSLLMKIITFFRVVAAACGVLCLVSHNYYHKMCIQTSFEGVYKLRRARGLREIIPMPYISAIKRAQKRFP